MHVRACTHKNTHTHTHTHIHTHMYVCTHKYTLTHAHTHTHTHTHTHFYKLTLVDFILCKNDSWNITGSLLICRLENSQCCSLLNGKGVHSVTAVQEHLSHPAKSNFIMTCLLQKEYLNTCTFAQNCVISIWQTRRQKFTKDRHLLLHWRTARHVTRRLSHDSREGYSGKQTVL